MARVTAYGALAGMLALPPGRMVAVAVFVGAAPTGAPGSAVVVVVVVSVWPAAGLAAISKAANRSPANTRLKPWRRDRGSKEVPPPVPSSSVGTGSCLSARPYQSGAWCERSLTNVQSDTVESVEL